MAALERIVDDLYDLVDTSDPARTTWDALRTRVQDKASQLARRLSELAEQLSDGVHETSGRRRVILERLEATAGSVARFASALTNHREGAAEWRRHHATLARNYAQLTIALERFELSAKARSFRRLAPVNYSRNTFHVATGLAGALTYHFLLDRTGAFVVMAILAGTFTTLEILRRRSASMNDALMRFPFFRAIARPAEYDRPNSSTYYAFGLLIAVLVASQRAVEAGCIVLAIGDPMASLLGKRFGKTKLLGEKTLVGSLAFFGAATLAVFAFQAAVYPAVPIASALAFAGAAAAIGMVVELISRRVDDNFSIPLAVAIALTTMFG